MSRADQVVFELDPAGPLSADERAAVKALAALSDASIDASDIPPWTDDLAARAGPNPFLGRPGQRRRNLRRKEGP